MGNLVPHFSHFRNTFGLSIVEVGQKIEEGSFKTKIRLHLKEQWRTFRSLLSMDYNKTILEISLVRSDSFPKKKKKKTKFVN